MTLSKHDRGLVAIIIFIPLCVIGVTLRSSRINEEEGRGAREAAVHWLRDNNVDVVELECGGEEGVNSNRTLCWVVYRDTVGAFHKETLSCKYRVCRTL